MVRQTDRRGGWRDSGRIEGRALHYGVVRGAAGMKSSLVAGSLSSGKERPPSLGSRVTLQMKDTSLPLVSFAC